MIPPDILLVVGDDPAFVRYLLAALGEAGYTAAGATACRTAMRLVSEVAPNLAIIGHSQPGATGIDVFEKMRQINPRLDGILVTTRGSEAVAFRAGRVGMAGYIRKPFALRHLLKQIDSLRTKRPHAGDASSLSRPIPYAARRVAAQIARVALAAEDVRTTQEWGRLVGVSSGTLRGWCQAARVRPRDVLSLGRAVRAYRISGAGQASAEDIVNFADSRAREKFLDDAGLKDRLPSSIDDFLIRQRFVGQPLLIDEVRSALGSDLGVRNA